MPNIVIGDPHVLRVLLRRGLLWSKVERAHCVLSRQKRSSGGAGCWCSGKSVHRLGNVALAV